MPKLHNGSTWDLNPVSLGCESGILPLSRHAPCVRMCVCACVRMCVLQFHARDRTFYFCKRQFDYSFVFSK